MNLAPRFDTALEVTSPLAAARVSSAYGPQNTYERDTPIHTVFERQAALTPTADAIVDDHGVLSYAELDRLANRLANYLRMQGVRSGSAVGVAVDRSRDLPVVLLAILKAGGAYVPLDVSHPFERTAFIVADASVEVVIVDRCRDADGCYRNARLIALGSDAATIAACSPAAPCTGSDTFSTTPAPSEPLAYIMYTSGSTGRPKGVAVTHRGVVRLVRGADYFTAGAGETFLQFAPAAFDASTFEIWGALLNGARLAVPRPGLLSIDDLGEAVARFGVTVLWLTASIFARVVEAQPTGFDGLRQLLTGGSAGSPQHMIRFLARYSQCRLVNGYGPTENTTFSTTFVLASAQAIGTNPPIGSPIAHSSAHVVDELLRPVARGEVGELCVGGDGVAQGYVNLPAETAARFVADPFSNDPAARLYRTGDRARMRADGTIEFLGRTDDQVKISGFRIELGEIEAVLRAHPDIRDAAVVAVDRDGGEKTLGAHVVTATGARIDEPGVRAYLRAKLPPFMIPPRIVVGSDLPLHASGKIDRVALAASFAVHRLGTNTPAARPSTGRMPLLRQVAEVWSEVLDGEPAPGADVNFFDAGGDSIKLLQLQSLLNERLQAGLSIMDLFEHTTIARITAFITSARSR